MALTTPPFRVARSGHTIDGRTIAPEALLQAAKNYDRDIYTAVIWPDHQRYFNLGVVHSVTAQKNKDGGVDLYAVLEPNDFYRSNNAYRQRLFTSVELMPDFAKSGEWYLSGLAATDSPASLGTEEVKFSQLPDSKNLYSAFIEVDINNTSDEQAPALLKRLLQTFSKQQAEDTMASQEYTELKTKFEQQTKDMDALKAQLQAFTAGDGKPNDDAELVKLTKENQALTEKVTELTTKFTALETNYQALSDKLAAAMQEQPGTPSGQHATETDALTDC